LARKEVEQESLQNEIEALRIELTGTTNYLQLIQTNPILLDKQQCD